MARKPQRRHNNRKKSRTWYTIDLHIHTPGSDDYQQDDVTYLDILKQAEVRGLNAIAFTDHNTVKGYQEMLAEIDRLKYLSALGRAEPDETRRLAEYERLLDKILLFPGFEFTATLGFHILGIFPPDTPVRQLEHILLSLRVPLEVLEQGSSAVGASSDVLTAYKVIREAGGLAIAAHANSAHGVAMRGVDFGGQTRIAYTQDDNLHALEVTDLEKRGRYTTARFFDGTKPGYPRRMRCIQGSDAHRLTVNPQRPKDLGMGDRATEILLPDCSFDAIKAVFEGTDFSLTRPYRSSRDPFDHVQAAREEGESIVQAFHPSMTRKGGYLNRITEDVCAFANTNGGTIYIGISRNPTDPPVGVGRVNSTIEKLYAEIDQRLSPSMDIEIDTLTTQKKAVLRIQVPRGDKIPYALDENKIYIRDEAESTVAVRDEIVSLVMGNAPTPRTTSAPTDEPLATITPDPSSGEPDAPSSDINVILENGETAAPRTGVEVVGTEKRRGTYYHVMRDLRNGNIIHNVTRSSARRLWHYAIQQAEKTNPAELQIDWKDDAACIRYYKKAGTVRYDLAQKVKKKGKKTQTRFYYGVTEDGMHGAWTQFIQDADDVSEE